MCMRGTNFFAWKKVKQVRIDLKTSQTFVTAGEREVKLRFFDKFCFNARRPFTASSYTFKVQAKVP